METRANYVLVGGFVLLLIAGLMAFIVWFARLQFNAEFNRYDILFDGTVTGLSEGSPVRYSGVRVGEVRTIALDPQDPNRVAVSIEVDAMTPVREGTTARLEIQGLTGARYVLLSGGAPGAPELAKAPGRERPIIPARTSELEQVIAGAPELLENANRLVVSANAFLNDDMRISLQATLANLETITGAFAERSDAIGRLIDQSNETMANLGRASASFDTLLAQLSHDGRRLAAEAETTLSSVRQLARSADRSVGGAAEDMQRLLRELRGSAQAFTAMTNEIQALVAENRQPLHDFTAGGLYELNSLLIEARSLLAGLNRVTTEVQRDPARFLFGDQQSGYEAGKE